MSKEKYRRIIVHAGLHKTGTTSIQDNCYKHRDLLLEHGIFYPSFRFRDRLIVNHSDPITGAICSVDKLYAMPVRMHVEEDPTEAIETFSAQFNEILDTPRADTLLLSAEQLCDFKPNDLQNLRTRLLECTDKLEVMAFIRSPASSLESILQQRNVSGVLVEPQSILRVVGKRFHRLESAFPDLLEMHNFHDAVQHPSGLVGYFLCTLGIPPEKVAELEFQQSNQRFTLEAHKLIRAINEVYPANGQDPEHEIKRKYMDIKPLLSVPGQRFRIDNFKESEIYTAAVNEGILLQHKLKFKFPDNTQEDLQPPWQSATLYALEDAVRKLPHPEFHEVIVKFLNDEAADMASSRPETAILLKFIASKIASHTEPSPEIFLEKLGADYFKFAALQVEQNSPEMALDLMSVALHLRPKAEFMIEKIERYKKRAAK